LALRFAGLRFGAGRFAGGLRPTADLPAAFVTFGFAAWSRAQIREGLIKLASALKLGASRPSAETTKEKK